MLPKANRIPRSDIRMILKTGKRLQSPDFSCIFLKTNNSLSRLACIVSTKVAKHAVDRNRMKRLLREAFQHLLPTVSPGFDCLIIAQKNFEDKKEIEIEQSLCDLLTKINLA